MEQGRCKTCTHWERLDDAWEITFHGVRAGHCNNNAFANKDVPPREGVSAVTEEGYLDTILMDEDFGCVHWAPVTAPRPPTPDR